MTLSPNARRAILIYLVSLVAYAAASNTRMQGHSPDGDHYIWLAWSWLHGRLDLGRTPPHGNDWAQVEHLTLADGRELRGATLQGSRETFRTLKGEILQVPAAEVKHREIKYYVSFPPFPGVLMLPMVAVAGLNSNDVVFTVVLAGLAPALFFLLLRRLRERGDSTRSERDDLWLTAVLGVGSVYYYSSVIGQVWYTAHVASVILVVLYCLASLDAKRPVLAGLALVCGFLSRPEILFAAPLFLWEAVRRHSRPVSPEGGEEDEPNDKMKLARARAAEAAAEIERLGGEREKLPALAELRAGLRLQRLRLRLAWHRLDRPALLRTLIAFAVPVALLGFGAGALNYARFGRLTEFGHTYLNVRWTPRIQRFGLFNYVFLGRNLACLLALVPRIVRGSPWVQVSWHGLAIWVTTPVILWVLWPREKGRLHLPLWVTTACVAVPDLFYQNSGWVQFGYRFALDYIVFLLCLIAIGGRRLGFWFKLLVIVGVGVNLFGALTFGRAPMFYFDGLFPPGID